MKIYSIRKLFILTQAIALAIAFLYQYDAAPSREYNFVLIYSLWNSISYLWLFFMELKHAPDFHPYQILALVTAQFIGFNGISLYDELSSGKNLYFGSSQINDAIHIGITYLSLEHLILFAIFYALESRNKHKGNNRPIAHRIQQSKVPYYKWGLKFYAFVWGLRMVGVVVPLSSISSILVGLTTTGHIVALFLLTFAMIQTPSNPSAKKWHWLIVAVEIALVMGHGMKEEIIRTLIPYCVFLLIGYKAGYVRFNKKTVLQVAAIGAFVLLFVFPYVSVFRNISINTGKSWDQISVSEALSEYALYVNKEGKYARDEEERGAGYLMSRAGSIGCNAFSIDYAQQNGNVPELFAYCCISVIPRIVWPDKPQIVLGGMVDSLARGNDDWMSPDSADSYGNSFSLGFVGSCYLCLGFGGAMLLIILHALFIWSLWNFLKRAILYNVVALWAFAALIFLLLKDFESFGDCGLSFLIFNSVYLFICKWIYKGPHHLVEQ